VSANGPASAPPPGQPPLRRRRAPNDAKLVALRATIRAASPKSRQFLHQEYYDLYAGQELHPRHTASIIVLRCSQPQLSLPTPTQFIPNLSSSNPSLEAIAQMSTLPDNSRPRPTPHGVDSSNVPAPPHPLRMEANNGTSTRTSINLSGWSCPV
jgi:hypothetical protein